MSFSDRMLAVRTEEHLHALMLEVREEGSANWTLAAVRERVPDALWPTLATHFDGEGRILPWEEPRPRLEPLRTFIERFHSRLAEVRLAPRAAPRSARPRRPRQRSTSAKARPTSEPLGSAAPSARPGIGPAAERVSPPGSATPATALPPDPGPKNSLCEICQKQVGRLVPWRGGEMCVDCKTLLEAR